MYKQSFGSRGQIQFADEHEYYKFLGYLAKSDGTTSLVWEHNEDQGAWASEGRIQILSPIPYPFQLQETAGVGNILSRVNCNEFIENIRSDHNFVVGKRQNIIEIGSTIPEEYMTDFNDGLNL
jgi:hypothetical protein